ncbi:MAG TPA: thioredoxin family protein [Fimbriimonadaceae bacterium]|jgi:thiol-disulfide isomerase/thioredoxin
MYKPLLAFAFAAISPALLASGFKQSTPPPRPGIPTAPGWYEELPPALAQAKKSGKDILIDFGGSNWCEGCILLKKRIFTKPEFFDKASPSFVLVDIDTLTPDAMPKDKMARYIALQKKYAVGAFPSVFLCTPEGDAYAWATFQPNILEPDAYWDYLKPFINRGVRFRGGLRKAAGLRGFAKATAMVGALSQIRSDFLWTYHADMIAQLQRLDPADRTGFLAYLNGRKAYDAFILRLKYPEALKHYRAFLDSLKGLKGRERDEAFAKGGGERNDPNSINPNITASDVDRLISKYNLKGETLQQAQVVKAVIYTDNDQPAKALECFRKVVAESSHLSPFDNGQYFQVDPDSLQAIQATLASCQGQPDKPTMYLALQQIFHNQLPDRYEIDCEATVDTDFRPLFAVRGALNWQFQKAVAQESAPLEGQAKTDFVAKMTGAKKAIDDVEMAKIRKVMRS